MTGRFTVLASGSSGNAALLEANGFGLLIDCGLHPRILTARLAEMGTTWNAIHAVVITHTHTDHWKDLTLADLRSKKIPLWAHPAHFDFLAGASRSFESLDQAGLTRAYQSNHPHVLAAGLSFRPIRVSHDSDPTFAFRIDAHDANGLAWSVGYASDLGCPSDELIEAFVGVDVLAVEYNHDLKLERNSSRPRFLVERVLGDCGHLSNDQAADLTATIAARSGEGFPRHLVQLHLSRDCNRPELASASGRAALATLNPDTEVITARQDTVAKSISLMRRPDSSRRGQSRTSVPVPSVPVPSVPVPRPLPRRSAVQQPSLPGFEG